MAYGLILWTWWMEKTRYFTKVRVGNAKLWEKGKPLLRNLDMELTFILMVINMKENG